VRPAPDSARAHELSASEISASGTTDQQYQPQFPISATRIEHVAKYIPEVKDTRPKRYRAQNGQEERYVQPAPDEVWQIIF